MRFNKEDFSEDELTLLKIAFRLLDVVVEDGRYLDYSGDYRNDVFCLKEKLGIYDIVS